MIDYEKGYIGKNFNSLSTLGNTLTDGDNRMKSLLKLFSTKPKK